MKINGWSLASLCIMSFLIGAQIQQRDDKSKLNDLHDELKIWENPQDPYYWVDLTATWKDDTLSLKTQGNVLCSFSSKKDFFKESGGLQMRIGLEKDPMTNQSVITSFSDNLTMPAKELDALNK
jgi:hypothetical protein